MGVDAMKRLWTHFWHPPILAQAIVDVTTGCDICRVSNFKAGQTLPLGLVPKEQGVGQEIVIDYTDMGVRTRGKRYEDAGGGIKA